MVVSSCRIHWSQSQLNRATVREPDKVSAMVASDRIGNVHEAVALLDEADTRLARSTRDTLMAIEDHLSQERGTTVQAMPPWVQRPSVSWRRASEAGGPEADLGLNSRLITHD